MTLAESKKAYSALMNYGLLWPGSSILLKDPSLNRYTEEYIECIAAAVPRVVPRLDSMRSTDSSIMQLLKIAWGLKEFTERMVWKQVLAILEIVRERNSTSNLSSMLYKNLGMFVKAKSCWASSIPIRFVRKSSAIILWAISQLRKLITL
eukprot:gene31857-41340_t